MSALLGEDVCEEEFAIAQAGGGLLLDDFAHREPALPGDRGRDQPKASHRRHPEGFQRYDGVTQARIFFCDGAGAYVRQVSADVTAAEQGAGRARYPDGDVAMLGRRAGGRGIDGAGEKGESSERGKEFMECIHTL